MKYASLLPASLCLVLGACGVGAAGLAQPPGPTAPVVVTQQPAAAAAAAPLPAADPAAASGPGSATLSGTVAGNTLSPATALWGIGRTPSGSRMLAVKISDQADECARLTAQATKAGSSALWLRTVGVAFDGTNAQVPATFSADAPSATFYALDASCNNGIPDDQAWASSGQVAMQLGANNQVTGSFSLAMGSQGEALSGNFVAVACPAISTLIANPAEVRSCQ